MEKVAWTPIMVGVFLSCCSSWVEETEEEGWEVFGVAAAVDGKDAMLLC